MRSMLVIGLGRFGSNLAIKLTELGNEVLAVDRDEEIVNKIAPKVTRAQIGDCMDIDVLKTLGVSDFDVCFVCIGINIQASLEITCQLKDLGAKYVVAKTDRELHTKFLQKIGADEVIFPERDMAQRTAMRYCTKGAFDYIELTPEYAIFEAAVPKSWIGKSLRELDIRSQHSINVVGIKEGGRVVPAVSADRPFVQDEHLILAGSKKDLLHLLEKS
jgi:trk system potassium uptake protein TrkA